MATASDLAFLRGRPMHKEYACPNKASALVLYVDSPRKTARSEAVAIFYEIVYWRGYYSGMQEFVGVMYKYTINPEPECLPADKNAEGVVKPEPQARVLPRPRHFYPPVNTRCEGFIMLIIYSFLYFKEETNAFHYQKVAIFLYRKSVERECRWKGEERNQALFQNLNSETCKLNKICNNAGYQPTIQELLPETWTPWVVFRLF